MKQIPLFILSAAIAFTPGLFPKSSAWAVTVSFVHPPAQVEASQEVMVSVAFQKEATDEENRLVFILELRRLADDALLVKQIDDNAGSGYSLASSTATFSLTVPAEEGPLYFAARAVPWSLNRAVVSQYEFYPTDGTHPYLWSGGGYGVTQDIYYLGELIAPTNAEHTTYCSGITFETCVIAYENYNATYGHATIGSMSADDMRSFRRLWYGVTDAEKLVARAITDYSLGVEISDFEQVQRGDFVQFWRHSGSGHSVVFVGWVKNGTGEITGFNYWSSQGSTNGIGYNTESFGDSWGVNRSRFWVGRLRKPRDEADDHWVLGEADTRSRPTFVGSGLPNWQAY